MVYTSAHNIIVDDIVSASSGDHLNPLVNSDCIIVQISTSIVFHVTVILT